MSVRVEKPRVTTTESLRHGPLRCMRCGQKAEVLTLDANGKQACAVCMGERFPQVEVVDAAPSKAD